MLVDSLFRFILALAGGALAYAVTAISTVTVVRMQSELDPSPALMLAIHIAALVLGTLVVYGVAREWAFRSQRAHRECLPRFIGLALSGIATHEAAFYGLLALMPWPYIWTLACTMVAAVLAGFAIARRWVFQA